MGKDPKQIRKRRLYTQDVLKKAILALESGECSSLREAASTYGVPASTLHDKIKGNTPLDCKVGPLPYLDRVSKEAGLSVSIEEQIYTYVLRQSRRGFPLKRENLLQMVTKLLDAEKIESPFPSKIPGRRWREGFFRRHPKLVEKGAEHHSLARSKLTEAAIRSWFQKIHNFLDEEELLYLLNCPERILNCDETPFRICETTGKFIGVKGESLQYVDTNGGDKETFTVMVTASADGTMLTPMLVFKYQRLPEKVKESCPPGWAYIRTDSGWVTGSAMLEYGKILLKDLVARGLLDPVGNRQKVFLELDGYTAHGDVQFSFFCEEHGIVLICTIANGTHVIQPVDFGINAPLKKGWCRSLQKHKMLDGDRITKLTIGVKLQEAFSQISAETIINAFRCCGIYPFDPDAVDYTKLISYHCLEQQKEDEAARLASSPLMIENSAALTALEGLILPLVLGQMQMTFEMNISWTGETCYEKLFDAWASLKSKSHELQKQCTHGSQSPAHELQLVEDEVPSADQEIRLSNTIRSSDENSSALRDEFEDFSDEQEIDTTEEHSNPWEVVEDGPRVPVQDMSTERLNPQQIEDQLDGAEEVDSILDRIFTDKEEDRPESNDSGFSLCASRASQSFSPTTEVAHTSMSPTHDSPPAKGQQCKVRSTAEILKLLFQNDPEDRVESDVETESSEQRSDATSSCADSSLPNSTKDLTNTAGNFKVPVVKRGRALSKESLELLTPSSVKTKARKYKTRENVYFLATAKHRDLKAKAASVKKKKTEKKSKIHSNIVNEPPNFEGSACQFCLVSQAEDNNNDKKRKVIWSFCIKCKKWMHFNCLPRRQRLSLPTLVKRISAGEKFDFDCCS